MAILAQQYPVYQPAMRIVDNITNASRAVITTTFPHQYADGIVVRVILPPGFSMQVLNQQQSPITVIDDTSFSVEFDTSLIEPFTVPAQYPENRQYAQVVPVGEINETLYQATRNVLPYPAT